MDKCYLGKNLKKLREDNKISQSRLGDALGVSGAYIQQIEKGIKKNPSIDLIYKIASFFDIPPISLLEYDFSDQYQVFASISELSNNLRQYAKNQDKMFKTEENFKRLFIQPSKWNDEYYENSVGLLHAMKKNSFFEIPTNSDKILKQLQSNVPFTKDNITTNEDLCYKLNVNSKKISNVLNLASNITTDSLQTLCKYLNLSNEEEAFLYSMYIYKTNNNLFRIVIFYYYLKDEYGIELNYPNEDFISIGTKLNKEFNLNLSLGFVLGHYEKSIVTEIINNTNKDRNIYRNIIETLYNLDKTYSFSYNELSLEDSYNICTKLAENLKYELYEKSLTNKKYNAKFFKEDK
ncbi:MAG: helix-turn-helix domain-containing protein [Clostridium sp.]